MTLDRELRRGDVGTDVRYVKDMLYFLGYLKKKPTHNKFGDDTLQAVLDFQRKNKDNYGKQLKVDGVVGELTFGAIEREYRLVLNSSDEQRTLRRGDVGPDVLELKNMLYSLGYLKKKPTHNLFGDDTKAAVMDFQRVNKDIYGEPLKVDGIVGPLTFGAIQRELDGAGSSTVLVPSLFRNISAVNLQRINAALSTQASRERILIVEDVLSYAYDDKAGIPGPTALYVFGANLYDKDGQTFFATEAYIEARAKARPEYFTNGRKGWMIAQVRKQRLACSDCSGMIVGILRKYGYKSGSFDATANGLGGNSHSKSISKNNLLPGDWVHKDGHIGMYVGGGLVVEFAGGAYGCQLTELDNRRCRNLMDGSIDKMSAWTSYRRPKYY